MAYTKVINLKKKNDFANLVLWVIVYKVFIGIPCNQKVKYNFWNSHSLH